MSIDVRATVTCTIGGVARPLISATVSDSYPPAGGGLITTRGECLLDGIYTPAINSAVVFQWQKPGKSLRTLPRYLRVTSYSIDPFAKTTTVAYGCPLTLRSEHQALLELEQEEGVQRTDIPEVEVTWWKDEPFVPKVQASSVADDCLAAVGVGGTVSLSGEFILPVYPGDGKREEWEFSSSYISTLESLLAGEGLYGAVSKIGSFVTQTSLNGAGPGPALHTTSVITLQPVGVGGLPASTYRCYYSYNALQKDCLKLEQPTEVCTETTGDELTRTVRYRTDSDLDDPDNEPTEASFSYSYTPSTRTCVYRDEYGREYKVVETAQEYGLLDSYAALVASAGFAASAEATASAARTKITTTTRTFDLAGHVLTETVEVTHDRNVMLGVLDLPYATAAYKDSTGETVAAAHRVTATRSGRFVVERIERTTGPEAQDLRVTTRRWVAYGYTPDGQQASAEQGRDSVNAGVLNAIVTDGEQLIEQPVEWQTIEDAAKQWKEELLIAEELEGSTGNDSGIEKQVRISLYPKRNFIDLLGDGAGLGPNVKVLSLPLATDDTTIHKFTNRFIDGTFATVLPTIPDDPTMVAGVQRFIRNTRDIDVGLRYGMSMQVDPDVLGEHIEPVFFTVNDVMNVYASVARTYTLDASGVVASFDALYKGIAGGVEGGTPSGPIPDGLLAFPPLPDTSTDPDRGPVVDWGDVTLVPAFTPITPVEGGIGIGVEAYRLNYDVARTQTAEAGIGVGVEAQVAP